MLRSFGGVARCACGGRARPPESFVKLREKLWPVEPRRATVASAGLLSSRSDIAGAMTCSRGARDAPGQPHSNSWAGGAGSSAGVV
jgi:hypothetical protein